MANSPGPLSSHDNAIQSPWQVVARHSREVQLEVPRRGCAPPAATTAHRAGRRNRPFQIARKIRIAWESQSTRPKARSSIVSERGRSCRAFLVSCAPLLTRRSHGHCCLCSTRSRAPVARAATRCCGTSARRLPRGTRARLAVRPQQFRAGGTESDRHLVHWPTLDASARRDGRRVLAGAGVRPAARRCRHCGADAGCAGAWRPTLAQGSAGGVDGAMGSASHGAAVSRGCLGWACDAAPVRARARGGATRRWNSGCHG